MKYNYNTQDCRRVPLILNWLGEEWPRFMQMLNDKEKEKCRTSMVLLKVLIYIPKHQHTERILLLKYCKLARELNKMLKNGWITSESKHMCVATKEKIEG